MAKTSKDIFDKTETFLAKRDGIDKVLKVLRYSSKLVLASALTEPKSDLHARLKAFEGSIGTSRKAYRLGKWLQNLNAIRKQPIRSHLDVLDLLANIGEGVYYFLEQLTWLIKAGLLDKSYASRISLLSAAAEVFGYAGSLTVNIIHVRASMERESMLAIELLQYLKGERDTKAEQQIVAELKALEAKRLVRTLAIIQDAADAALTLPDIQGGRYAVTENKAVLALAGLLSAAISINKTWQKVS